ncbi:carboxypeptidase C [Saccharomycopsis crataegensis]|uniref:Carboxypeptidase n=1 Tax=Saccharomycopsis crataegensis TaxID=43959 RepID=A0AAV5QJ30_9ASCO|nr:carboxypeptidase C [Saccharomycopsis crataegensis]
MKLSALLPLAYLIGASSASASNSFVDILAPHNNQQRPLINENIQNKLHSQFDGASTLLQSAANALGVSLDSLSNDIKITWSEISMKFPSIVSNLQFVSQPKKHSKKSNWDFQVADASHPNHQLRVKKTNAAKLGVDSTKQYSGYLDVEDEDKHFFYWFFESRNDPANDPVVLWLNGGPGCSSLTGLFFELGPSSINAELKPIDNPYSWNNNASVIFLDQPVNVGYSYSSGGVSDTIAAGKDVHAFLNLFFKQFPEYSHLDFHIAGESYAGHYIPVFAAEILEHQDTNNFNLTSVLIGNGLTDPLRQYEYYQPMACGEGGHPQVLSDEECDAMLENEPKCLNLIKSCYETESVWSCVPAAIYCNNQAFGPYQKTGLNVYDIRSPCESGAPGGLCYKGLAYIDDYLNQDYVKEAVGAEVDEYQSCNMDINRNFLFAGDWMKPYHTKVIELLDTYDLPVIIYAGDKDFICNWLGNHGWSDYLEYSKHEQFAKTKLHNYYTLAGEHAGEVKNFDKFTFLRLFNGGHMVPMDQPEASLDFFNRWISGEYTLSE